MRPRIVSTAPGACNVQGASAAVKYRRTGSGWSSRRPAANRFSPASARAESSSSRHTPAILVATGYVLPDGRRSLLHYHQVGTFGLLRRAVSFSTLGVDVRLLRLP